MIVQLLRLVSLLFIISLVSNRSAGVQLSEKEEWSRHATHIRTSPSGKLHPIEGAILDMGRPHHKYPLYGKAKVTLNVHYATKPRAFEPAVMVDDDRAFESMRVHREKLERKRAGGPILPYYRHFGAMCPQVIGEWQVELNGYQKIPSENLQVPMADGVTTKSSFVVTEDGDEDNPLNFNIFAPYKGGNHRVLCFLHGGGYLQGSATYISIHGIVTQFVAHDVLAVTINYRLGPFGFLSGEELNLGIRDVLIALKWIKKYIHFFGGDPNHITIAGESAGASTVGRLALELLRHPLPPVEGSPLVQQFVLVSGSARLMDRHSSVWGVRDIRTDFFKELYRMKSMVYHEDIHESERMKVAKAADTNEILKAAIAANIHWWDIDFYHASKSKRSNTSTSATAITSEWFDTVAAELVEKQTTSEKAKFLFIVTRDEAANHHEYAHSGIPRLAKHPQQPVLPKLSTLYSYYLFRSFLQPHMEKYGYHWHSSMATKHHSMTNDKQGGGELSGVAATTSEPHQHSSNMQSRHRLFQPAKWFLKAREVYGEDLAQTLDNFQKEFQLRPRKYPFSDFKRYYIDIQVLSDMMFVLATAKEAIALAKRHNVYLMRLNVNVRQGDNFLFPDDVIPHNMGSSMLFMSWGCFWNAQEDPKKCTEKAMALGREMIAFMNEDPNEEGARFRKKYALEALAAANGTPAVRALPFLEINYPKSNEWRADGYMSAKRLAFWDELFGPNGFHEPPFTDTNGVPIDFGRLQREAVLKATSLSVDQEGRAVAYGLMGEFPSELSSTPANWELPNFIRKEPIEGGDVLTLVDLSPTMRRGTLSEEL